ncbi:MAG: hypothetical protein HYV27_14705 [Candidatus Hydrogenedentes bacterium]|nr:hypothetical protein [Candidatus Hydrogenedentota bacterium]
MFEKSEKWGTALALLTTAIVSAFMGSAYAQERAPIVEARGPLETLHPGGSSALEIALSWPSAQEPLVVYAPEIPDFDGGALVFSGMRTSQENGQTRVTCRFTLTPNRAGLLHFPEVTLPYMPAALVKDQAPLPEPTFAAHHRFEDVEVAEANGARGVWLGAAALGAAAFAVAGVWVYRRRGVPVTQSGGPDFQAMLHETRRHRLDGDFYHYFQSLTRVARALGAAGNDLCARLERRTQEVGYQGTRPADEELDGWLRDVEHAIRKQREENPLT